MISIFENLFSESSRVELTDLSCIQFHDWALKSTVDPLFYFWSQWRCNHFYTREPLSSRYFPRHLTLMSYQDNFFHFSIIRPTMNMHIRVYLLTLCSHRDFIYAAHFSPLSRISLLFCWRSLTFIVEEKYLASLTLNLSLRVRCVRLFFKSA